MAASPWRGVAAPGSTITCQAAFEQGEPEAAAHVGDPLPDLDDYFPSQQAYYEGLAPG